VLGTASHDLSQAVPENQHSNPIGRGILHAAPAASFLRLDPNRPGLRLCHFLEALPPGRFR